MLASVGCSLHKAIDRRCCHVEWQDGATCHVGGRDERYNNRLDKDVNADTLTYTLVDHMAIASCSERHERADVECAADCG
jgi:hypothetical protein